jgi:type VI secretion system protein ImpJ
MSDRSKVIWSEGLFLRPQHFQQQERYLESYVEGRAAALRPCSWGVQELELNRDVPGKLAIRRARGVFPDGTPFSIPDHDPEPSPLDITADVRNRRVYLALPLRRGGALESVKNAGLESLARQGVRDLELRDATMESATTEVIQTGGLRTRLLLEGSPMEDFSCIPVAHVDQTRADQQVALDEGFMPAALSTKACPPLDRFLKSLHDLLHARGEALAKIVTGNAPGGGLGVMRDFMRFQAINRYEPLIRHCGELATLHPEELFRLLLLMIGDFAGLGREVQRPVVLPTYDHANLRVSFEPAIVALRTYIIEEGVPPLVSITVERRNENAYLARVDESLIESATFILAVKAGMPPEEIRRRVPQLMTVAPAIRLKELVEAPVAGLDVQPLAQLPPLIPYFPSYVYFEIARTCPSRRDLWNDMRGSGAFGMFVPHGLPNVEFLMWAIRGPR